MAAKLSHNWGPSLVPLATVFRGVTWFIAMDVLTLAVLVAFPAITLWLPQALL